MSRKEAEIESTNWTRVAEEWWLKKNDTLNYSVTILPFTQKVHQLSSTTESVVIHGMNKEQYSRVMPFFISSL